MARKPTKPASAGNRGKGGKPRDRDAAALALASGRTIRAAATAGAVCERSVRNWLAESSFVARVRQLRAELFALAVGRLADLSGKAADVLGGLLDSESEPVKRLAARDVLELGTRMRETTDLADELAALKKEVMGDANANDAAGVGPAAGSDSRPLAEGAGDVASDPTG